MLTTLMASALVINELMAANLGTVMSPAINFDSWIELYNPDDTPVNLGGMYLSDNGADLHRWKMPTDVGSVPAKGFKVIWLGSHDIKASQA
ncbi:MAG: lamin tail domain-containing protein, partial [Bacteroidaceae bacterium]|nr:lamin tail domain-containing protein [Bacteroidaceae bacterium]